MTVLPIVIAPDPLLSQPSAPVETIDASIRTLVEDMFETMYASNGIGLCAVQVGVLKQVIVVDTEWSSERYDTGASDTEDKKSGNPIVLINPKVTERSEALREYEEGCLSFPGQSSSVTRPDTITVTFQDIDGNEQTLHAEGLLATCIQHEMDHMHGVVFVDHISRLKRDMILRRLKKAKKLGTLEA